MKCDTPYAQTNVQLFNQLRSEGYSKQEIERVSQAYEFGMRLFTGLFLPSGKTFIDHLVGTASILASLHMPVEIVGAGLIHAAYLHGDFGSFQKGITENKRKCVRSMVGGEIEEYVARYDRLLLTSRDISLFQDTVAQLSAIDRHVILMRLANELEHNLEYGNLYFAHGVKAQRGHQLYMEKRGPQLIDLAERLGFSSLAAELETTLKNDAAVELPLEPCIRCNHTVAYLILPGSCRERLRILYHRKLSEFLQLGTRVLQRAKSLCMQLKSRPA